VARRAPGQLVGSVATVASPGGQFKLLNLQTRLHELMQVTKLITVLDCYTSGRAALRSLGGAATSAWGRAAALRWVR